MNLAKHDPETEVEMNMTPMIDVVFLLIIFFMIITDMTQQDLEELTLPMAEKASKDEPKADEWRPILNITYDGRMVVSRDVLYDPATHDSLANPYGDVELWLAGAAERMEKEHFNKEEKTGPLIPGEALLLRADESTPFKHMQKVMELCGKTGIQIWKVQFAASVPEKPEDEN